MEIVVCIKQVPDAFEVKIDPETKRIIREGVDSIINPYDNYAIEEAIRLKERFGGTVTAISMGPPQAERALRDAMAMGVDEAILLSDMAFAGSDTLATSYTLSDGIKKLGKFDVIVCGRETFDGSTGQVGPEIAHHLNISYITYVSKIHNISDGVIECSGLMEDHYEELKACLPVLITVVKEINQPRIPSLKGMLKAKKAQINTWKSENLEGDISCYGQDGSPTRVVDVWTEQMKKDGRVIEGETEKVTDVLFDELKKLGIV